MSDLVLVQGCKEEFLTNSRGRPSTFSYMVDLLLEQPGFMSDLVLVQGCRAEFLTNSHGRPYCNTLTILYLPGVI